MARRPVVHPNGQPRDGLRPGRSRHTFIAPLGVNYGRRRKIVVPPWFDPAMTQIEPGVFINFRTDRVVVIDPTTQANNFHGSLAQAIAAGVLSFARNSLAMRINSQGVWETVAANTPRLIHDPSTLAPQGYLPEPGRTNVMLWSQDFTNAAWVKTDSTITANATTAPDGTMSASLVTEGSLGTAATRQIVTATMASQPVSGSLFMKRSAVNDWVQILLTDGTANEGMNCWVNLATGALGAVSHRGTSTLPTASIQQAAFGFWFVRLGCTMAASASNAQLYFRSATGDGSSVRVSGAAYYVWQADFNVGFSLATTPIKTAGTSVPRLADVLSMLSTKMPADGGKMSGVMTYRELPIGIGIPWCMNNIAAPGQNRAYVQVGAAGRKGDMIVSSGGVSQAAIVDAAAGLVTDNTRSKLAFRIGPNDFAISINGRPVVVDPAGSYPVGIEIHHMGSLYGNTQQSRPIEDLFLVPGRLFSNDDLLRLSVLTP